MSFTELVARPSAGGVNQGIRAPTAAFLEQLLGLPRDDFTGVCQNPTNPDFKRMVLTKSVGPFKATGLKPALASLAEVFTDVKNEIPELHPQLGSAGMLCCRFRKIKGKVVPPPSSHSWGTAIDLTIDKKLDPQGDNKVMRGLALLAKFMNAHMWVWGATFPTEDAMHFEASQELLVRWKDAGLLRP